MANKALHLAAMAAIFTAPCAYAGPVVGGYTFTGANATPGTPSAFTFNRNVTFDGTLASSSASQGTGTSTAAQSQSNVWVNRLAVQSDSTVGAVIGGGVSMFAVNQRITGDPGLATISYTFALDGSFSPGSDSHLPSQFTGQQSLFFYLLAYSGQAVGLSQGYDPYGWYFRFDSTLGYATPNRSPGSPGYVSTIGPWLAATAGCFGSDTRCTQGGIFNDQRTITFSVPTNQDYYILGFLAAQTDGQADFFHTAKLQTVTLDPKFDLVSDDGGALVRGANGGFSLLSTVPEPATWITLITGFAIMGLGLRARQRRPLQAR
ncbi:MAG: hypothetical protein JSR96_09660 [Proteobacteria bacterium]|nr:hypothetical protein [Pseudomonadota bacterium]